MDVVVARIHTFKIEECIISLKEEQKKEKIKHSRNVKVLKRQQIGHPTFKLISNNNIK